MSSLPDLTFPWMAKFARTAKEARQAGLDMVLAGAPQSGKTHLLEIEQRSMHQTDQEVFSVRLQREPKVLRQFQFLLRKLGPNSMPKDWTLHSLSCLAELLARRLRLGNTGLVILSNCQVADREFFNVLLDVMAQLRCSSILAGSSWPVLA